MRRTFMVTMATMAMAGSAAAQDQPSAPVAGHVPVVTNPRWAKLPNANDLARVWPARARGQSGAARIRCTVTSRGTLDKCNVVSEQPEGLGFGEAALMMAPFFVMQPKTVDGTPVGGAVVQIPIRFQSVGGPPPLNAQIKVATKLGWSAAPTAAQMAAAFPTKAVGKASSGHVVLRCVVWRDGGIRQCNTITEQPEGLGFAHAANELTRQFRIYDDAGYAKQFTDAYVDLPFDFRDPQHPAPPLELISPYWLQTADPAMAGKLFPEEAAKAGLKTGRAILACRAAHDGTLTGCTVAQEDPPNLGFGQAALVIAGVMKMNPWTQQGVPVDGAAIRLPIRVNMSETAAAPH